MAAAGVSGQQYNDHRLPFPTTVQGAQLRTASICVSRTRAAAAAAEPASEAESTAPHLSIGTAALHAHLKRRPWSQHLHLVCNSSATCAAGQELPALFNGIVKPHDRLPESAPTFDSV